MSEHPKEIVVTIKGDDNTYKQKFLVYDEFILEPGSPVLKDLVAEAQSSYRGEVNEIKVKISMQWL